MEQPWNARVFENILLFKECVFQCNWGFSTGPRISWTRCVAKLWKVWHRHSWFCRHSNIFVILEHQKYIISMIPTLLKQRLRWNKHFERLSRKSLVLCKENALDWCTANKFTNKDGSVSTNGWETSHYWLHCILKSNWSDSWDICCPSCG